MGTTTACATKKFVRTEVDAVGTRVETLSQSLETTQEATQQNQARHHARSMRRPIRSASGRRTPRLRRQRAAGSAAAAASAKIDAVDASTKRLVYEVVINEDQGNFKFASADLPEAAQARIDEMIARAQGESARQLRRDRRAHRLERRQDRSISASAKRAPKR